MNEARSPVRALIALSSNLGDRAAVLASAVAALDASPGVSVLRVSPWFETAPVGGPPAQPRFLNGAAELRTSLPARALLDLLLGIERAHGRVRDGVKDGPRTLDLDLLFYGSERIAEPGLVVPHPRLEERVFVLEPLARLEPERLLPGCGRTVSDRLAELKRGERPAAVTPRRGRP